jgi:hypothetical protein
MPAPPPPSYAKAPFTPDAFATRGFTPIRNPHYVYNMDDSFRQASGHPQARNVLERPPLPGGADPRLTSYGTRPPVAGLTPIVPFAYQTPLNVWALHPA